MSPSTITDEVGSDVFPEETNVLTYSSWFAFQIELLQEHESPVGPCDACLFDPSGSSCHVYEVKVSKSPID